MTNFSNPKDYYAQLGFTVNIAHRYMKHLSYSNSSVEYDKLIVKQTEPITMIILHQKSIVDKNQISKKIILKQL